MHVKLMQHQLWYAPVRGHIRRSITLLCTTPVRQENEWAATELWMALPGCWLAASGKRPIPERAP